MKLTPRALAATALLALLAGCDGTIQPDIGPNPIYEEQCRQEGFDPGTTEYVDCVRELSEPD